MSLHSIPTLPPVRNLSPDDLIAVIDNNDLRTPVKATLSQLGAVSGPTPLTTAIRYVANGATATPVVGDPTKPFPTLNAALSNAVIAGQNAHIVLLNATYGEEFLLQYNTLVPEFYVECTLKSPPHGSPDSHDAAIIRISQWSFNPVQLKIKSDRSVSVKFSGTQISLAVTAWFTSLKRLIVEATRTNYINNFYVKLSDCEDYQLSFNPAGGTGPVGNSCTIDIINSGQVHSKIELYRDDTSTNPYFSSGANVTLYSSFAGMISMQSGADNLYHWNSSYLLYSTITNSTNLGGGYLHLIY